MEETRYTLKELNYIVNDTGPDGWKPLKKVSFEDVKKMKKINKE